MTLPGWDDPLDDTMQDRLEEKFRDLLLSIPDLLPLKVVFIGEPGAVPTDLHPFGVVFLELEADANQQGYGASTGVRNYAYTGYISIDVLHKDALHLVPGPDRRADVESYKLAKKYIRAARKKVMEWGGPFGALEQEPVVSADGREKTVELITERIANGLVTRDTNNYSNRSSFDFRAMTTRNFF